MSIVALKEQASILQDGRGCQSILISFKVGVMLLLVPIKKVDTVMAGHRRGYRIYNYNCVGGSEFIN